MSFIRSTGRALTLIVSIGLFTTSSFAQLQKIVEKQDLFGPYIIQNDTMIFSSSGLNTNLFVSVDGGTSWTEPQNPTPFKPDKVFNFKGKFYLFESDDGESVFRNVDSLSHWEAVNGFETDAETDGASALITNGEYLWLKSRGATFNKDMYYTSTDGTNWSEVNTGAFGKTDMTGAGFSADSIIAQKEDPDGWSLWSTLDDGINWNEIAHHDSTLNLKDIQVTDKAVYASMGNNRDRTHLFRYDLVDGTWSHLKDGNKAILEYYVLGDTVVMANRETEIYVSLDAGDNWTSYQADSGTEKFYNPRIFGDMIYVIASDGLYAMSLSGQSTANEYSNEDNSRPGMIRLFQNYPNPFNPSTEIKFELLEPAKVNLAVYNVLGQEVTVLINRNMSKGTHIHRFNAEGLSGGLYLYRITLGNTVKTGKMTLIK